METHQVVSLGDDRLLLAADLKVAITRQGLFQLSFELPEGLEVESLSGAALSHLDAEAKDGDRIGRDHAAQRPHVSATRIFP